MWFFRVAECCGVLRRGCVVWRSVSACFCVFLRVSACFCCVSACFCVFLRVSACFCVFLRVIPSVFEGFLVMQSAS